MRRWERRYLLRCRHLDIWSVKKVSFIYMVSRLFPRFTSYNIYYRKSEIYVISDQKPDSTSHAKTSVKQMVNNFGPKVNNWVKAIR